MPTDCVFSIQFYNLGQFVRKTVNVSPGLKDNQNNDFSFIKLFFTAYVLCSLNLVKLKDVRAQKLPTHRFF